MISACKNTHFPENGRSLFLENTNYHQLATKLKIRRSQFFKNSFLKIHESFMEIRVDNTYLGNLISSSLQSLNQISKHHGFAHSTLHL